MANQVKLYTPFNKQVDVHKSCINPKTFFVVVVAGRQAGKSLLAINQALEWALNNPNSITLWVSPTYGQATKIYKQCLNAIVKLPIVKGYKFTEIELKNGSIIKFASAAQEDSLRGESVDYLVLDEAAFIKEETFQTILLPMLNVRGKKCLIATTPKGKNWIHRMFSKGLGENTSKYKSYRFVSKDNPHSNEDIIELARQSMPEVLFRQEYLAEFVDSAAIFENILELTTGTLITEPKPGDTYYAGIDIGMKNDSTVFTLINQNGSVVYLDRFTDVTAPVLKARLTKSIELFKPKTIYIELNNQGMPIYDDLTAKGIKGLKGFNTTGKSKPEIINQLINAFASKKITLPEHEVLKSELEAFTLTFSSTGHPKFSAPNGFHDDCVLSLAIAWECLSKEQMTATYTFM